MQSDAITPMRLVPQSLAAILAERRERSRLVLSKFTAEAAEQAAQHPDKLGIAGKVKDVASVHKTLWPEQVPANQILNMNILTGVTPPRIIPPGEKVMCRSVGKKCRTRKRRGDCTLSAATTAPGCMGACGRPAQTVLRHIEAETLVTDQGDLLMNQHWQHSEWRDFELS